MSRYRTHVFRTITEELPSEFDEAKHLITWGMTMLGNLEFTLDEFLPEENILFRIKSLDFSFAAALLLKVVGPS